MLLTREIVQYIEYLNCLGYKPRTQETYGYNLKIFQRYLESESINSLSEITRKAILKYQMYLMNKQPAISIETQCLNLSILKSFMKYLVKSEQMIFNPASELELPRQRSKLPKGIMSVEEVKKLLKQPDINDRLGVRNRAILEILYATAIRSQEIRNLNIRDVDLKEKTLRILGSKGEKDRIVPLGKTACEYLEKYIQKIRPCLLKNPEEQALFLGNRSTRLTRNGLRIIVRQYAKQSGFTKNITPHSLRHSCATHMLKNKASLRHIQVLLGHKSLETTQKYIRVEISDLKRAHRKYHPLER